MERRPYFNRGRWELERERHRLDKPYPPAGIRDAASLGELIPGVMKRLGMETQHWVSVLDEEWNAIAGNDVSKHTRPGKITGTELIVFVDSSVWLNELARYGQKELLANIQKRFGTDKVRSLRFQMDPDER